MNFPASMSSSICSRVMKWYSLPFISPGRGGLDVSDKSVIVSFKKNTRLKQIKWIFPTLQLFLNYFNFFDRFTKHFLFRFSYFSNYFYLAIYWSLI